LNLFSLDDLLQEAHSFSPATTEPEFSCPGQISQ
jgi:hypothetical protein